MRSNKIQREYITAKALVEMLEQQMEQMERAYISAHGIVNPDGTTPKLIYCITDDSAFDKANEEFSAQVAACGLEAEYNTAQDALRAAEDRLIRYGLSIAPAGVLATLEKGVKANCTIRQKLIDLVLRLDVSTVPQRYYSNHQNWRHTAGRGAFSAAEAPKTQEALMAFKFLGQRQLGKLPSRWVSTILMVAIDAEQVLNTGEAALPGCKAPHRQRNSGFGGRGRSRFPWRDGG